MLGFSLEQMKHFCVSGGTFSGSTVEAYLLGALGETREVLKLNMDCNSFGWGGGVSFVIIVVNYLCFQKALGWQLTMRLS